MYSWGGRATFTGGKYDFKDADRAYFDGLRDASDARGGRSYTRRPEPDLDLVDPRGKKISSGSQNPIIFGIDTTGSMADWPAEIFDRLPLIYQTLSQYRDDVEISFSAIGDATCDNWPLQVNHFGKGVELEDHIKALCPEGGGGGHITESYELFGYFMLEHCDVPNATSPFLFLLGDETFYANVKPEEVEHYIGDNLQGPLGSHSIWEGLTEKFNLYLLHKPYGAGGRSEVDRQVLESWSNAIGSQKIKEIPSKERAVDVAIGIIAKQWGEYSDFKTSLTLRHPDRRTQESVLDALKDVTEVTADGRSIVNGAKGKTKTLTDLM